MVLNGSDFFPCFLSLHLPLSCDLFVPAQLEAKEVSKQLLEPFTPDDAFMFGPQSVLDFDHNQMVAHSKDSLSFDGVYSLS